MVFESCLLPDSYSYKQENRISVCTEQKERQVVREEGITFPLGYWVAYAPSTGVGSQQLNLV